MASNRFTEGVKPGGLTTGTEMRILLCYLLDSTQAPVSRQQIEDVLVGEELVNYFVMAESLSALQEQGLIEGSDEGYTVTAAGRTVAQTLQDDVPRTVREAAVRGVIRAQQYAAKQAAHQSEILPCGAGHSVQCSIGDEAGPLFRMELFMPDDLSAKAVRERFVENGDEVYKLVLAALTDNQQLASEALEKLK